MIGFRTFTNIHSWAVYGAGFSDPDGYDQFHPKGMTDAELGAAVREGLMASRFIGPDHTDRERILNFWNKEQIKASENRLKAQAGVKTLKALYSGAGYVALRLMTGIITVTPLKHAGSGAWESIPGNEPVTLNETVSGTSLGVEIRRALETSREASER